ncbi:hypothetical protein M8J76_009823 [Diaphorina citri]|nr:hypothetical protein M8J76_009823 [Diaphorina citri]
MIEKFLTIGNLKNTQKSFKVHNDPRIPSTSFSCNGRAPGYYADLDTGCQVYHMCDDGSRQYSYTCPNTTLFHQRMLICAHWYQVNCSHSEHDFDANLLIGQKDKPFVDEDFWKHRFGGAGNTNFPPQELPIRSVQSNVNTGKSPNQIPDTPAKTTPFKFNNRITLTPPQFSQQTSTPQFVQPPPPVQQFAAQPPTPQFVKQFQAQDLSQQQPPTPQFIQQPPPVQASQATFAPVQQTPDVRAPLPTEQATVIVQPPQRAFVQPTQQTFSQNFVRRPAVEFEPPEYTDQENNAFTQTRVVKPSTELEVPYDEAVPQQAGQQKPSIELEPPLQDDSLRTIDQNVLAPNKRDNTNRPTTNQATGDKSSNDNAGAIQSNNTLDDRFTQVYILPSGKEPVRGPYEHPDLVRNKVIFTDWNSLLEQKPDDTLPTSNFNEYVNGKIPGEEEVETPSDDLQRDFSNHFPARPFSSFPSTERIDTSATVQTVTRVPSGINVKVFLESGPEQSGDQAFQHSPLNRNDFTSAGSDGQFSGKPQLAVELLPPFDANELAPNNQFSPNNQLSPFPLGPSSPDLTQVTFSDLPLSASAQPLNLDDENNTVVIQNPFQHPFYKVRKMNDERNIIFIPLTDSDFALELRKVPLNRTRVSRRVVARSRQARRTESQSNPGQRVSRQARSTEKESKPEHEEQEEAVKCGHCHQGYLVDRGNCVPCVPLR